MSGLDAGSVAGETAAHKQKIETPSPDNATAEERQFCLYILQHQSFIELVYLSLFIFLFYPQLSITTQNMFLFCFWVIVGLGCQVGAGQPAHVAAHFNIEH